MDIHQQIKQLRKQIDQHNIRYYVKDDPNTPENEAWVGGVSPSKKKTKKKSSAS